MKNKLSTDTKILSCRERILRTLRGEKVDRIPIFPPIPWNPWMLIEQRPRAGLYAEPNYQVVADLVEEHCDDFCRSRVLGGMFDRRFMLIPQEHISVASREIVGDKTVVTYRVTTPKGDLRSVEETVHGIQTTYYTEPLLKDKSDVDKIFSVPFRFDKPDLKHFFDEQEKIGDRAVMEVGISTPLVSTSRMFDFTQFFEWCLTERATIVKLLETHLERIYVKLEYLLQNNVGPCFWFGGSEQATPPMMSNQMYDDFVVRYDSQLFDLVHKYESLVHVHCHGKVNTVFERIIDMGVDMLDPMEPPPDGDLEIGEAKRRANGRITLMGNIEIRDLDFATPEEIDDKVKHAINDGGKKYFMLYPSATAISSITDQYRNNAIQYIRSGLEHGKF